LGENREGSPHIRGRETTSRDLPEAHKDVAVDVCSPECRLSFEELGTAVHIENDARLSPVYDFFTTSVYAGYQHNPPGISFLGKKTWFPGNDEELG
jgi:hypothetical protein